MRPCSALQSVVGCGEMSGILHLCRDLHSFLKCLPPTQLVHKRLTFTTCILSSGDMALNLVQMYRGCFSVLRTTQLLSTFELVAWGVTLLCGFLDSSVCFLGAAHEASDAWACKSMKSRRF